MILADRAHQLLEQQKQDWDLLRSGYESLANAQTRDFLFDHFVVKVQFNPGRIISSSAQVDDETIRSRPCFLCPQNRPAEQQALPLHDDLVLLCNPYPIFPEHFTIPALSHLPQQIAEHFMLMLDLAKDLHPRYTVFYNGPRCGASAPDHLHFQAGSRGFMPIDAEFGSLPKQVLVEQRDLRVSSVDSYLRHFIAIEGSDRAKLQTVFAISHSSLARLNQTDDEPMMNIITTFHAGSWRVNIFPRARHRPSFYLAEGDDRILLSPAAVDLGGVCITPLRHDFERLTHDHLVQMFAEVTLPKDAFARLSDEIRSGLARLS